MTALTPGGAYARVLHRAGRSRAASAGRDGFTRRGEPARELVHGLGQPGRSGAARPPASALLVHGGSSGIGLAAIQLGKLLGAEVFATAGSAEKCAACVAFGADRAIAYRDEDFVEVVKAVGGADVVLDMVGGDYIPRNVAALRRGGRLVMIAFLAGSRAELDFSAVMVKRLTLTGSTLRPRTIAEKTAIRDALAERVWPAFASGRLKPRIDAEFALGDAAAAHRLMESSAHIGKIVIERSRASDLVTGQSAPEIFCATRSSSRAESDV